MANLRGNIALSTVLVFSALFVITAIAILFQAMSFSGSTSSYTNQIYAQNAAVSCVEEALFKISRDNNFPGPVELILGEDPDESCEAVIDIQGDVREIQVKGIYRTANYSEKKIIEDITASEWVINTE